MQTLTKAEERVMQVVWALDGPFFVKDLLDKLPDNPPYNTVASVVRLLEAKGFLGYKAYGRTHEYFPQITREQYRKRGFRQLLESYFDGSPARLLSFMAEEKHLTREELEELRRLIDENPERP
jgi:predicted transcriptional regulator